MNEIDNLKRQDVVRQLTLEKSPCSALLLVLPSELAVLLMLVSTSVHTVSQLSFLRAVRYLFLWPGGRICLFGSFQL